MVNTQIDYESKDPYDSQIPKLNADDPNHITFDAPKEFVVSTQLLVRSLDYVSI